MKLIGGPCDGLEASKYAGPDVHRIQVPFCRTLLEGARGIFGTHVYARHPDGSYHFQRTIPPKPHPGLDP